MSLERRLGKLEALEGRVESPQDQRAEARRKRISGALNTLARLRREQGVATEDIVPETHEEREALSICEALGKRLEG